jgi:hypothetical protein
VSVLSALAFTPQTLQAARSARHHLAQLAFSFNASAHTQVRVSLAKRLLSRRHASWRALGHAATLAASSGRNSRTLATGTLAAGTYRLTLTPQRGSARSLVLRVL